MTVTAIVLQWSTIALDTELIYLELQRVDMISTCRNHCAYKKCMASVTWNKWQHNEHTLISPRIAVRGVSDGKAWFCNFMCNFSLRAGTWTHS